MKVSVVLSKARGIINDESGSEWTDPQLLVWYNDGVVVTRQARPDTKLSAAGVFIPYAASTAPSTDDVIFADAYVWSIAVAEYIAYRAFGEDAGDRRDLELSNHHWDGFTRYTQML
jgi:hypothetical protein